MSEIQLQGPRPTPAQLAWSDAEVGVLIHYDIQVFRPGFDFRKHWGRPLPAAIFNPASLDTDQWLSTAAAAGAKYAVLVAKHGTGFSLWPTQAHPYSVKSSPWRGGKGDIVGDFIKSCEKFGIKPGLYYSVACNGYLGVDDPGRVVGGDPAKQKEYNAIVEHQLTELWTRYGKLFEIWFDGGALPPEKGGPDVLPLLLKHQPDAVCFQGPDRYPSLLRWVGNEDGIAPADCWSTANTAYKTSGGDAYFPVNGRGDPDGKIWAPAETDMPNRRHSAFEGGWFWKKGQDGFLFAKEELMERYYTAVGRNTNLLLGMVIDDRGLVPQADAARFAEFGAEVSRRFAAPAGETAGEGEQLTLRFSDPSRVNTAVIMEDITQGQTIRAFTLEALTDEGFRQVCSGESIGHKRIERFDDIVTSALRLRCTKSTDTPRIRRLAAYQV